MMNRIKPFIAFLIITLGACKNDDYAILPIDETPIEGVTLTKITTITEDKLFLTSSGELFFPWGFNYTNPQIIGLIEDNWDSENTWAIIEEDFAEMKRYSANIVRIHLQLHRFMNNANTPNQSALQKLQRLVEVAEDAGLYLDVTGLASYRKTDTPEWYNNLNDTERWNTHAVFWKNIAATIGDSKAVFAFNLMNEPVVSVGCDGTAECDWLPGPGFGGYHFVQNITRDPDLVYSTTIKDWIGTLSSAIRSEDQNTLITVGFLALGSVTQFEEDLDYVSIHVYPKSGELQRSIDKVINNQGNSPLILEEISNLDCNIQELEDFLNQIEGKYQGLMGHYFGKTLSQMQANNSFSDATRANFINFFRANNPN